MLGSWTLQLKNSLLLKYLVNALPFLSLPLIGLPRYFYECSSYLQESQERVNIATVSSVASLEGQMSCFAGLRKAFTVVRLWIKSDI
jgi:hypothetical protein